ncbi:MAG TPA: SdrD B-like domain-containing protein [Woeseiaceae bacterium]|nr:SdrD B-like domain-containing protein [Woeseiaceae bacterium]
MKNRHLRHALRCGAAISLVLLSLPAAAEHAWMDDSNRGRNPPPDGSVPSLNHQFPRVHAHEIAGGAESYSKYQLITAHGGTFPTIETIQERYSPETMLLRHISGRAYQSFNYNTCHISGGMAFESTTASSQGGPSADGCGIYAGHWLYRAGTRLRQSIAAGDTVLPVESASRIDAGQYVVIYNAPTGSFNNAEHARVVSVNRSNNTVQVQRGFKSNKFSHPSGAIVAQHVLGQGSNPQLWAFNMSTQSPRDGSGRTFGQFYADWLGKNLLRYGTGTRTTANVAGVLFDADFYAEYTVNKVDADNDLVVDDGRGPNGQNWLGDGLDDFYARVGQRLPGYYILVGVHHGRGFESAHGLQMENWIDYGNGDYNPKPVYSKLSSMLATYFFNAQERAIGPALITNLTKTPTKLYSGGHDNVTSNAPFRLAFTTALMEDGYFGTHSELVADPWWDEFAVDVRQGSANFGKAVAKSNTTAVHQHRGWLGQALGPFERIYNDADFAASKSLIGNNTFDSNLNGWQSNQVNISRVTSGTMDGAGAMRVAPPSLSAGEFGPQVISDTVTTAASTPYTLVFSVRSTGYRIIRVSLGNETVPIPVSERWRRYVVTMKPGSGTTRLKFVVGGDDSELWLDSVYLFRGDANVFKREFENGLAIANATAQSRTVDVGPGFRRIDGAQDRTVNNGNSVTSVTLAPHDGIVLVRNEGGSTPPSGSGSIGDYVWRDADGDGHQDGNESGWSGATVRLRECRGSVISSRTTNTNGAYLFDNLAPGSYQVEFVKPGDGKYSPYQKSSSGSDSDANTTTGLSWCASITTSGEKRDGIDAGFVPTSGSGSTGGGTSIGNYVWNDLDRDGIQDSNEPGVSDVAVQLRDCNGIWIAGTRTGNGGRYLFDGLAAGGYVIRFVAPSGATFSRQGAGTSGGKDSNAGSNGYATCLRVGAGESRLGIDAGLIFN